MISVSERTGAPRTSQGDGRNDVGFGGGGPNPRCFWSASVCSETPEYFQVLPGYDEVPPLAETYCERHYVLVMAELLEVHLPQCDGRLLDHVERWGRIGG